MQDNNGKAKALRTQIDALRELATGGDLARREFKTQADKIMAVFRLGGLGAEHEKLWSDYQACWDEYKNHRYKTKVDSAATRDRVLTMIAHTVNAADGATERHEIDRAKGLAAEARAHLKASARLVPKDWHLVRYELDNMRRSIGQGIEQVQSRQRAVAQHAYAQALDAFSYESLSDAWQVFKASQKTINACWLSSLDWQAFRQQMDALYNRFQVAWASKRETWREQQTQKLAEFREKITRTEAFIDKQQECADRCRSQAVDARTDDFAERMNGFATDHEQKASEAQETLGRLREIAENIERQLSETSR